MLIIPRYGRIFATDVNPAFLSIVYSLSRTAVKTEAPVNKNISCYLIFKRNQNPSAIQSPSVIHNSSVTKKIFYTQMESEVTIHTWHLRDGRHGTVAKKGNHLYPGDRLTDREASVHRSLRLLSMKRIAHSVKHERNVVMTRIWPARTSSECMFFAMT